MAGRGFGEGGRKPAGDRFPDKPRAIADRHPEARPREQKSRVARRKAPCIANDARTKTTVAPPGAPLPELFEEAKKGHRRPRAANNRGDEARAYVVVPAKAGTHTPRRRLGAK